MLRRRLKAIIIYSQTTLLTQLATIHQIITVITVTRVIIVAITIVLLHRVQAHSLHMERHQEAELQQ